MKALMLVAALSLPMAVEAAPKHYGAIKAGSDLTQTLNQLANQSQRIARRAAANGNYVRARKFRQINRQAGSLARQVRHRIVRPLRRGVRLFRVHRSFHTLQNQFRVLNRSVSTVVVKNPRFLQTVRQGRYLHNLLHSRLGPCHFPPAPAPAP